MKLSLVKKNILKSTDYKCYCTGMKQKCTRDHGTDQNGESWYQVSNHFYLECSKYLKCFCIIPSAFNVKENIRQSKADRCYLLICTLKIYIHLFRHWKSRESFRCTGAQVEDEPPEWWWLLINSKDRCLSNMLKDGESIISAVDTKLSELKK